MRLLTVCPTRRRPEVVKEMLDSFKATRSPGTQIVFYVTHDTPEITAKYHEVLKGEWYMVGPELTQVQIYNMFMCSLFPDVLYYAIADDDFFYITPGWDEKLIKIIEKNGGVGMACAEDRLTDWEKWKHPAGMVMSGNIPRSLGYAVYPKIKGMGTDMFFGKLLNPAGLLYRDPSIVIEHRHIWNKKRDWDQNYRDKYEKPDTTNEGYAAVAEWEKARMVKDTEKLNMVKERR